MHSITYCLSSRKEASEIESSAILPHLKDINALLQQAVMTHKALHQKKSVLANKQALLVKDKIATGKKCDLQ